MNVLTIPQSSPGAAKALFGLPSHNIKKSRKVTKEYLTIKEFSKLSGIETTTLRYWDDIGLFTPEKRNPDNNYRYYSPQQIVAANFITVMSSLNIPLKTIAEAEAQREPESIMRLIEQQQRVLDKEMLRLRECYSIIHTRREMIIKGMKVDASKISIEQRDEQEMILGPPNEFKEGKTFYEPFMEFCNQAKELRINLNYPIGGYHDSMDSFLQAPSQPDCFFSLDSSGNSKRKAGDYLVGYSRGYYGELGDLPQRIEACAKEHSLSFTGPVYVCYLLDEICYRDPSEYLVEVSVALDR